MQRNDQALYRDYAISMWKGTYRFQRLLAQQVNPRLEYFDRVVHDWKGFSVLDLGCGGGFMAEALTKRGANIIGIDPSPDMLKTAREHAKTGRLNITYKEGTGEAIPLGRDSVDCVVCVDVLEHVQDIGKVISEIARVLQPGGIFFFDTINRNWLSRFMAVTLVEDILRIIPKGAHNPGKFIRPEELRLHLEQNGLKCADKFTGMKISRINKNLDFEIGLTASTKVMYIGHAVKAK